MDCRLIKPVPQSCSSQFKHGKGRHVLPHIFPDIEEHQSRHCVTKYPHTVQSCNTKVICGDDQTAMVLREAVHVHVRFHDCNCEKLHGTFEGFSLVQVRIHKLENVESPWHGQGPAHKVHNLIAFHKLRSFHGFMQWPVIPSPQSLPEDVLHDIGYPIFLFLWFIWVVCKKV